MNARNDNAIERYWMIRKKDFFLSRPLTEKELIQKIENGELSPLDEVCMSGSYWFGLHETHEVRNFFGNINLSRLSSGVDVEITSSTETEVLHRTQILEIPKALEKESARGRVESVSPLPQPVLESQEVQWAPLWVSFFCFLCLLIYLWSWS